MTKSTGKGPDSNRGARLYGVRKELGLSLERFAALGGTSKASQILYEKGNAPTADYLRGLAEHGIDVLFILTGMRTPPVVEQVRREYGPTLKKGALADEIERLVEEEKAAGVEREREDWDLWEAAMATVSEGIIQSGRRYDHAARARLILLAYDLLEEDATTSKERIIRLVKAS